MYIDIDVAYIINYYNLNILLFKSIITWLIYRILYLYRMIFCITVLMKFITIFY